MAIIFLRSTTENGPRTIVFVASEDNARLLAETAKFDAIAILPPRPAYASVAQIVAQRAHELEREITRIKRRNARREKADLFNVTRLFPKGKKKGADR